MGRRSVDATNARFTRLTRGEITTRFLRREECVVAFFFELAVFFFALAVLELVPELPVEVGLCALTREQVRNKSTTIRARGRTETSTRIVAPE
jgi:hypothetical protein